MRNLQKILALALALIMSFSLVATAGAFSDDGDISDSYKTAVNVLNGLEVFKGYDNGATFQPKGNITRAEVAAIIYRIATGDVKDSQASIYSTYGQFTDVADESWYSGYVNYCANAGYIKGRGNKVFDPQGQVTGYEALAMILRAVGYDKNGEFTGSNWQVRTASIANQRGITKNVTEGMLGQAATRETVAEILFRAILVNQVDFSANTLSYTEKATSLGYDIFKLEEVTGVVVANEFADLYDTDVLAASKTDLEVDGTVRHLDYASELTDIGESRHAYIAESKVLHLGDTGTNTVFETGAKTDISTSKKFEDVSKLTKTDDTEFYVNFGHDADWQSDWRICFEISGLKGTAADQYATKEAFVKFIKDEWGIEVKTSSITTARTDNMEVWAWRVEFKIDEHISPAYQAVIEYIFNVADKRVDEARDYVTGEVYVGTSSTKDVSDSMSLKQFKTEYIKDDNYDDNWNTSDNGEWVKIVDNNGDGKAEYAFLTEYWMDKATHTRTKDGSTVMEYNVLNEDDYDFRYLDGYEPAVGDVVLYTRIDGQALIQKVEPVNATVNYINFKDEIIRTTDSNEYGQSGIENDTDMEQIITAMDEKVSYNLYQDKYGYVRAYELTEGTKYGLVSELYYGYKQNGRFQTSKDLTVEMRAGSEKINEYLVNNAGTNRNVNEFVGDANWLELGTNFDRIYLDAYTDIGIGLNNRNELAERNILQPATAHLGLSTEGPGEGWYFAKSRTNVAKYVKDGDNGVKITSASEYAYDKNGNQLFYNLVDGQWVKNNEKNGIPVYAVDYIQLDHSNGVKEDERIYTIDVTPGNENNITNNNFELLNKYVNAVHDTEFYIVSEGNRRVAYFTDYEKMPKIDAGNINAMYAVARNTESDNASKDYWVADVVVIEVGNWTGDYDSISLAYFTNNYNGGTVRSLDTLNNKAENKMQTVVPNPADYTWNFRDWNDNDYGFYKLYDTTTEGDTTTADDIVKIDANFDDYGIYAGTITRINVIDSTSRDNYIMVDIGQGSDKFVDVDKASVYEIKETRNQANWKYVAEELHMCSTAHSDVKEGNQIIWIGNDDAVFIVVVDFTDKGEFTSPSWLYNGHAASLYTQIWNEQSVLSDSQIFANVKADAARAMALPETTQAEKDAKVLALQNVLAALSRINTANLTSSEKADYDSLVNSINAKIDELKKTEDQKDPAKYNAAKAAYEAALPLDEADEAALNAAKTAIEAALAADNANNLEDGQKAELEGWLAAVNAALEGGEEPAVSVNVTLRWKLNDKSNNYSELKLGTLGELGSVDVTNGQITIDSIDATPQGGTYFVYALNGVTAANEELEGEADFATGNWTVAIPEGTEEVLLTVHVIEGEFDPTLQLRADAPFAFNSGARAAIARAGDGEETTEYYFVTLRNGQEPADITNVKPEGAATFVETKKWLPGKEGYTIWRVTIAYDADALGGDLNNLNFAVTGKNEGEDPTPETVTIKVTAKDPSQVILGTATVDGAELTANADGSYSVDTGKTLVVPFTLDGSIPAADVGSVVAYLGAELAATATLNATKTGGTFEFAVTADAAYQVVFNKAVNITFSFAENGASVKEVKVGSEIKRADSNGIYTVLSGSELTVSAATSIASVTGRTLYIVVKNVANEVVAAAPVDNGAAVLTWNADADNEKYTVTTGYDELTKTPLATTDGMILSVISSDFSGKGVAYIDLRELNYDRPTNLEDLQKYLQTETGKKIEIQYADHKDTALGRIELGDQIFTPDAGENEQRGNHLGTIYAKVAGKDVKIYVNNAYAGYQVALGNEILGLFQNGMKLTITDGTLTYTDPITKAQVSKKVNGNWFTVSRKNQDGTTLFAEVESGNTESITLNMSVPVPETGADSAVVPDERYIAVPDKSVTYTIVVNSRPITIMDDYWIYDASGVKGSDPSNSGNDTAIYYARHGDTVDLSTLTVKPRGGVTVEKTVGGLPQEEYVSVSGSSPNVTFVMPGFDVKVVDNKQAWTVTVGGEAKITDETTGKLKSADIKALDPNSYVVITKNVGDETRYYKANGAKLDPVSNIGLDRFVPVSSLSAVVFDDNGYVVDTEYYEWYFDANADGSYTDREVKGYAKKGGTAYLTEDSTANGKAITTVDFGKVYTVQGSGKNMVVTETNGSTFTMPGKGVRVLDGVYAVRVAGSNKSVHTDNTGKLFDIATQGWESTDYVTITTTTGATTTYWKDGTGALAKVADNETHNLRYINVDDLSDMTFKYTDGDPKKSLSADAFTINAGYHKITFDSGVNGDKLMVTRTGNEFTHTGGFARSGDVVTVTLAATTTGLVVKKTDGTGAMSAEGSNTTWKFTMPDYDVVLHKGQQVLSVMVNNATADGIVKGDDAATDPTTNKIAGLAGKSWGKFVTITDADGAFYIVDDGNRFVKCAGDSLEDTSVYVPVASLEDVVWSTIANGTRTYADEYTVTTGYFRADFRSGAIGDKTKGSTVEVKGGDAVSFDEFGLKYVPRGTVLVVTPGLDANNYYIGDIHVTTDPVEIIMGTTCTEIEIKAGADDEPVNGPDELLSAVTLHLGRIWDTTAGADTGAFSEKYTLGTYQIASGSDLTNATKVSDGVYAFETVVKADGIINHKNGANQNGWWTGVCFELGDAVSTMTISKNGTPLAENKPGAAIQCEGPDGTSMNLDRAFALYVNAETPTARAYDITFKTSEGASVTINWTFRFETTAAPVAPVEFTSAPEESIFNSEI